MHKLKLLPRKEFSAMATPSFSNSQFSNHKYIRLQRIIVKRKRTLWELVKYHVLQKLVLKYPWF